MTVPARPPEAHAFTLIEVLVALSLAAMLSALLLAAYALVTTVQRGQAGRQTPNETAQRALGRLADDLERTIVVANDTQTVFRLLTGAAASNALWDLSFCRCAAEPGAPEVPWAEVDRVTYRLVEDEVTNRLLVCASRPLAGPGALQPARTNDLIPGLEQLDLQLFDGQRWQDHWPVTGQTSNVPRAARVEVTALRGGIRARSSAEVFIPVGNRIESRTKTNRPSVH
jgi:type II secretion system protein J